MITKLLNEVNEKIETLNNLVQDKEYFEKLEERIEKVNNYVQEQKKEIERLNNIINKLEKYLEEERDRLAEGTSHTYEDSLGKTRLVNEDIFNEITKIKDKLQELKGDGSNEKDTNE